PESSRPAAARPPPSPRRTNAGRAATAREAPPPPEAASARGFLRHVLLQLLQGRTLEPRHVHLADAQPPRDLRLGHLLVKPHGHDRALARRQVLHRTVEQVAHLDTLELRVRTANLLRDRALVLAVAAGDGLVERHRDVGRAHLHRFRHVVGRNAKPVGELPHGRLAIELVLHLLVDPHHRLVELLEPAWKTNRRALVSEVTLDLPGDGQRGEGRELVPQIWVEALDRLDQPEVADLD